jgi:hypothetical protein
LAYLLALADLIRDKPLRARLYGLMRHASAKGIAPEAVTDEVLAAYLRYRAGFNRRPPGQRSGSPCEERYVRAENPERSRASVTPTFFKAPCKDKQTLIHGPEIMRKLLIGGLAEHPAEGFIVGAQSQHGFIAAVALSNPKPNVFPPSAALGNSFMIIAAGFEPRPQLSFGLLVRPPRKAITSPRTTRQPRRGALS